MTLARLTAPFVLACCWFALGCSDSPARYQPATQAAVATAPKTAPHAKDSWPAANGVRDGSSGLPGKDEVVVTVLNRGKFDLVFSLSLEVTPRGGVIIKPGDKRQLFVKKDGYYRYSAYMGSPSNFAPDTKIAGGAITFAESCIWTWDNGFDAPRPLATQPSPGPSTSENAVGAFAVITNFTSNDPVKVAVYQDGQETDRLTLAKDKGAAAIRVTARETIKLVVSGAPQDGTATVPVKGVRSYQGLLLQITENGFVKFWPPSSAGRNVKLVPTRPEQGAPAPAPAPGFIGPFAVVTNFTGAEAVKVAVYQDGQETDRLTLAKDKGAAAIYVTAKETIQLVVAGAPKDGAATVPVAGARTFQGLLLQITDNGLVNYWPPSSSAQDVRIE